MSIIYKYFKTPLGSMMGAATDEGICLFDFEYRRSMSSIQKRIQDGLQMDYKEGEHPFLDKLEQQINEYIAGTRKEFDLPLHFVGTDFQKKVWNGLLQIPYGETRSYKQQSIFLGDVKAIRAVGTANGQNGIAIIVPCHRVIGENGSLIGYGGGLSKKKWLLEHEAKHCGKSLQMGIFES
ncbi:MAG: methylated-DNA--[protein]-cysteine S-methyltransferase [Bacteroidetes bacterium]|nr:methylated-DNA--[protein]-cysteine S-methyltransferase [Bacteroidota bacterium]